MLDIGACFDGVKMFVEDHGHIAALSANYPDSWWIQRAANNQALDELALLKDMPPEAVETWQLGGESHRSINTDHFRETEDCCVFEVDGWRLEVLFRIEDNHYQYAKLAQPDGNVWHGWSGYGVGAGLEDAGYGYSTSDREHMLMQLWPESIAG